MQIECCIFVLYILLQKKYDYVHQQHNVIPLINRTDEINNNNNYTFFHNHFYLVLQGNIYKCISIIGDFLTSSFRKIHVNIDEYLS